MTYAQRPLSIQRYTDVALETSVLSASPAQLITLLMDGALAAMRKARLFMQAGNVQGRGASISKAIDIVESGLKASVQKRDGADSLTENLITTYNAIVYHLLQANLNASPESLDLAETLLDGICQAWKDATQAAGARSDP